MGIPKGEVYKSAVKIAASMKRTPAQLKAAKREKAARDAAWGATDAAAAYVNDGSSWDAKGNKYNKAGVIVSGPDFKKGAGASSGTGNTGATGATGAGATGTGATGGTTPPPTRPDKNNPLTNRFKTPNELRKQAAALAALSVASEQSIRDQSAARQTGLAGLTTSLTNTLTGLGDRTRTGLAGIGGMYSGLMAGANQAGSTQVAAAGGDPTLASSQTGDPSITSQLLNLTAPTLGYAAAATSTGAQLQAGALQDLSKSLAARSSAISKGTADYLRQLQGEEYQKATGQIAIEQNAERLQLASGNAAWGQQMDVERLGMSQKAFDLSVSKFNRLVANDIASAGGDATKATDLVTNRILEQAYKYTSPKKVPRVGYRNYSVTYTADDGSIKSIKIQANSSEDAKRRSSSYRDAKIVAGSAVIDTLSPTRIQVEAQIRGIIMNAGLWTAEQADAWIVANEDALGITNLRP